MAIDPIDREVARNYDFFQRSLDDLLRDQAGRFALLRAAKVEEFFDSVGEADRAGWACFPDRLYSIQQVNATPIELGVYANGLD